MTFLTCCTVKVSQQASWSAAAIAARMFSADVQATSDKLLGGMMLLVAAVVFLYYTIWALFLVSSYAHLFAGRESLQRYPAQCGRLPRCYQTVLRQHHTHPCRAHRAAIPRPKLIPPLLLPRSRMGNTPSCRSPLTRHHGHRAVLRKGHDGGGAKTGGAVRQERMRERIRRTAVRTYSERGLRLDCMQLVA